MSEYKAVISWKRTGENFLKGRYSRDHTWSFDGGTVVPASSSPSVVPVPWSSATHVDPEEGYVAAIASCHMLWFLDFAKQSGFQVDLYDDEAVGIMIKDEHDKLWVSTVTLHPKTRFSGVKSPTTAEEDRLHQQAHVNCFIANSVKTRVVVNRR